MWLFYDLYVFFFKQKTAYEMRISDWSSDVCSSDLRTDWTVPCAHRRAARRGGVPVGGAGDTLSAIGAAGSGQGAHRAGSRTGRSAHGAVRNAAARKAGAERKRVG